MYGDSQLKHSPVSPVKVNFQQENWAQPSSATIESGDSHFEDGPQHRPSISTDRDLTRTLNAPTPPPHSPRYESSPRRNTLRQVAVPAPSILTHDSEPSKTTPLLGPISHTFGSDFGLLQPPGASQAKGTGTHDTNDANSSQDPTAQESYRLSRETATTASTSQPQTSNDSSATTSASSVSGTTNDLDNAQGRKSEDVSTEGSEEPQMVPQLQYHHQPFVAPKANSLVKEKNQRAVSTPELLDGGGANNRHLTPTSNTFRRSSMPRPPSSYSVYSDRGRSPGQYGNSHQRAPSAHSLSRRSPDNRLSTYAELLNVPYPQPAPAPLTLNNSQLRTAVGSNASLLSSQKTLEMYRQNVKKTNDFSIQYSFAVFLISTAQEQGLDSSEPKKKKQGPKSGRNQDGTFVEGTQSDSHALIREARAILQKLANAGYPFAQYYLADGYASGMFSKDGKEDYNSAFPLFVLAAKHGHAESAYRTGLCYEFGWGCRKDPAKAVQFLRTAASKRHPGAMTRLGTACLYGDLGEKRYREGIKWMKLATESADSIYSSAPYQLGCLYETGYGDDIFKDESYAAELFTQAADLGNAEANFRMGDAYEHGKLNCPRDPALSVHFYTGAAERDHAVAMMGLCAWYMVGAEPVLEKDEEEACEWARRAAQLGKLHHPSRPSHRNIA